MKIVESKKCMVQTLASSFATAEFTVSTIRKLGTCLAGRLVFNPSPARQLQSITRAMLLFSTAAFTIKTIRKFDTSLQGKGDSCSTRKRARRQLRSRPPFGGLNCLRFPRNLFPSLKPGIFSLLFLSYIWPHIVLMQLSLVLVGQNKHTLP